MRALREEILTWLADARPFALATVTQVSGSGPRAAGSCLIVSADGARFFGSVSSGCLENEVIDAAVSVLKDRGVRELRFGPEGDPLWREGLSCGGWVSVRVEPWWTFSPRAEMRAVGERVAQCLASDCELAVLSRGENHLALGAEGAPVGDVGSFSPALRERASGMLRDGAVSALIDDGAVFARTLLAPRRLLIVGAVDIARHLAGLATACGFRITVVDPRRHYATKERFPASGADGALVCAWPAAVISKFGLGPRDAAVVLTHDPKIDDEGLEELLRTKVGYIGALGSRTSHQARLARLRGRGLADAGLARIEGPAGIRLDNREPAGIALGMMAGIARWKAAQEGA